MVEGILAASASQMADHSASAGGSEADVAPLPAGMAGLVREYAGNEELQRILEDYRASNRWGRGPLRQAAVCRRPEAQHDQPHMDAIVCTKDLCRQSTRIIAPASSWC